MNARSPSTVVRTVFKIRRCIGMGTAMAILAPLALSGFPLQAAEAPRYGADLKAFLDEMDKAYPFFDVKDLRKGWPLVRAGLEKRVLRCGTDEDFLAIVLEAIRYLRDGHMGIVKARVSPPPPEPEWYPAVSFMPATRDRVIVMAAADGHVATLKPGTVITKIDGKPARAYLEAKAKDSWARGGSFSSKQRASLFEYRIPLRGKKGEKHAISFLDGARTRTATLTSDVEASGWPHTYNMPKDLTARGRSCLHGMLPSGVGYIYLRSIDRDTEPGIAAALQGHPDARGWIIDLRGNGGGGYDAALIERIGTLPRPVVGLIDAGCMSAGETFARDIVRGAGARLMGSTTAGCSSAKRTWDFPSGVATLTIPTRSRAGIDRQIEYFGIPPHEALEAVPEEVAKGLNSEIRRAEEYILKAAAARAK